MYTIIIPSRYGSTRLPGKPLLDIGGVPMITRCWQQAIKSKADRVIVATDDKRVQEAVPDAESVLCDVKYRTGSDRCAAVARDLNIEGTIVNLQGDSPFMP